MALKRTEHGRGYRYTLDGTPVMGVTSLIGGGLPRSALMGWAAKRAARYAVDNWRGLAPLVASGEAEAAYEEIKGAPFRERDAAAERGSQVHAYALSGAVDDEVPEELRGYVVSCGKFLADWDVHPLLTKTAIGSRTHHYAGTLELVAQLRGGEVALLDYKTSASGIWPETALRAAAYRYAEFYLGEDGVEVPMARFGITAAYAVHLRTDGYAVHPLTADEEAFRRFSEVAAVARSAKTLPDLIGDPVSPAHLLTGTEAR